jgi:coenzyme F420-reducing hydrogenase alpha subunit
MKKPMDEDARDKFLKQIPEQIEFMKKTVDIALKVIDDYWDVIANVGVVPTYYLGMTKNGVHDIYEGDIRVVTPDGKKIDYDVHKYLDCIGEHMDPDICNPDCKTLDVEPKEGVGVGITEAPRGLLIYNIWSDADGICKKLNLMVATNHNIAGIEKSLMHVAKQVFEDKALDGLKLPDPWIK